MANGFMTMLPVRKRADYARTLPATKFPSTQMPSQSTGTSPNFGSIQDLLSGKLNINPIRQIGGSETFERGIKAAQPFEGISPETQRILDIIEKNRQYQASQGQSQAAALAAKRGIQGSSTEQFGQAQAGESANRAAQEAQANLLLENLKRNQSLQDLQSKAFFDRAAQEGNIGAQLGINEAQLTADQRGKLAQLTSDEIASLRNMDFANRQLVLQTMLGQQGIDLAQQNIGVQQDIANQQAKYGLIGAIGSALIPGLMGGGGGLFGGGGGLGSLFGLGGGGSPLAAGAAGPASPGMFGAGGSLFNTAGTGAFGLGSLLPGLAGYSLGQNVFGNSTEGKVGGVAGGILGSMFGPGGTALGSFLGQGAGTQYSKLGDTAKSVISPLVNPVKTVKTVTKKVSNAVKKVFPF
jgi:hypothetical protein